jgi:DNA repair protein RadA/Sms
VAKNTRSKAPGYRCAECGNESAKWYGRCQECQAWGTLEEIGVPRAALAKIAAGAPSAPARPIAEVDV